MLLAKRTIKQLIIWRVVEAVLILALLGVVLGLHSFIQDKRRAAASLRSALEQSLASASRLTELEEKLADRRHDINRILAFVPRRDDLSSVIGRLEKSAADFNVRLTIPDVEEEIKKDEKGNIIKPSGPLREVRMHLVAAGDPENTLRWLHYLEYQPYLVQVADWQFTVRESVKRPLGAGLPAPPGGPPGSSEKDSQQPQKTGHLSAQAVISILAEEGDGQESGYED